MMELMTYMPGAMEGPMGGWDAGFWWPFMLVPLLVWFAVRVYSRGRGDSRPGATKDSSAEEILRERFARGEINAEEYEKSMEILRTGTARRTSEQDPAWERGERESY